jgi:hypothetical protein
MTEKVTKKWNDENTAVLVSAATAESPVSAATVEKLAEQLGFSARSIASKLRSLDYTVESLAKAHTSTFSEEETAALKEFIVANEGLYTYEEIASKLFAGKFDKRQIQGKVLSLELNTSVKATPKQAAVRTYSEAEEATFLEMAKAGAFLEDIAEKLGKQLNQVRGKALSLVQAGSLTSIPAQRESYAKAEDEDKIAALGDGIADKTIADLIALTGKTERGLKTLLTRRGIDCADYKGKAKREKADAKASA